MKKAAGLIFIIFSYMHGYTQNDLTNTGVISINSIVDTFYINGNFTNTNTAGLTNAGKMYVKGDITNNQGSNLTGAGIIFLNGTASQNVSATSAFNNLTINKSSGSAVLATNAIVNGNLNFIAGVIQTGGNSVILPTAATLTGAAQNTGWVNGKLQKNLATGAVNTMFETGDATVYAPVSIAFPNITTGGNLTVSTIVGDHPNIGSSIFVPNKSVNRYWIMANSGVVFSSYTAIFNFAASDVDAGSNTSVFGVGLYSGSWTMLGTSARNPTNIQAAGFSSFGSFAIGETYIVVPVTFKTIRAYKIREDIAVAWHVENEANIYTYEVERSAEGIAFSKINTTTANGSGDYQIIDTDPLKGNNFYRVKSLLAGNNNYSSIAKVNMEQADPKLAIYPNPVKGSLVTLHFNNLPKDVYQLHIYNTTGQLVGVQVVQHGGGTADHVILLDGHCLPGKYEIKLTGASVQLSTSLIKE